MFSIFRRASECPLFRSEKTPRLARKQGAYSVVAPAGLGEAVGRYYVDACGMSVICLRIGTVNPENAPTTPRHLATLLTHRDLVSLVRCCIAAPSDVGFGIVYGISRNTWRIWDLESARDLVGFEPVDDAEAYRR